MLHCNLCDYLKKVDTKGKKSAKYVCEMTGFEFEMSVEEYDMEYPCSSGKVYQRKLNLINCNRIESYDRTLNENWKLQYNKPHLKTYMQR